MKPVLGLLSLGMAFLLLCSCEGKSPRTDALNGGIPPTTATGFDVARMDSGERVGQITSRSINQRNVAIYQDGILIIGGGYMSGSIYRDRNDILWSPDGVQWWRTADRLITPERNSYSIGVFENQILIFGGKDSLNNIIDPFVYRADGFVIDPRSRHVASFVGGLIPRESPVLMAAGEKIVVIGGTERGGPVSTVFAIFDGKVVARSSIPGVRGLLISPQGWSTTKGYYLTDSEGDFWKSTDGIAWRKLQVDDRFKNRSGYVVIPRGTRWYLAGGEARLGEDLSGLCNDVWVSSDEGKTWTLLTKPAEAGYVASEGAGAWGHYRSFPAREYAAGVVLKGRLVVGGGRDGLGDLQDFWASDDGVTWFELK